MPDSGSGHHASSAPRPQSVLARLLSAAPILFLFRRHSHGAVECPREAGLVREPRVESNLPERQLARRQLCLGLFQPHATDVAACDLACRVNELSADLMQERPERFGGYAALPARTTVEMQARSENGACVGAGPSLESSNVSSLGGCVCCKYPDGSS